MDKENRQILEIGMRPSPLETAPSSGASGQESVSLVPEKQMVTRLRTVERLLVMESWLPISIRSLLAQEVPALRREFARRPKGWRERVGERLSALKDLCRSKEFSRGDSRVFSELEAIDSEFNHGAEFSSLQSA